MSIDELLKQQFSELTDFNLDNLKPDTLIQDVGFDSLDFLSIQVVLKKRVRLPFGF
ncbi:phosphopantetheine-binding protein [Izhakiella capsodis]|uniref:phosphopantetheine-binding protein n=1 Tax=Izhakiella capsodis TaxID=1367852 RepID=UPI0015A6AB7C|nr:phosphopantetheine-binding protein [Izhakiella capsodis]